MNQKKMIKIKEIKKMLKKNNSHQKYIFIFKNKQMRFLYTEISLIFESSITNEKLANIEERLSSMPTKDNFVSSLSEISLFFNSEFQTLDWESLGVSLWYSFQNSIYYNKKLSSLCEITKENYPELNHLKKISFAKWLESFYDTKNINFNSYVQKVLKRII